MENVTGKQIVDKYIELSLSDNLEPVATQLFPIVNSLTHTNKYDVFIYCKSKTQPVKI